ncbi:MAG TPA: UbiA-like polyprenyltransferase [Candidatus Krumholzibacteria bacterium]|nr:UbiA-like polyprenyltransferase [Candidatus Krumholzibacteria bacterium]
MSQGLVGRYLGLVKFEHTLFALPFAVMSLLIATGGRPPLAVLGWVLVAMVGARSAAMAFNRLADRHIDARNPRTADRHLPAGQVSVGGVAVFIGLSSALLVLAAWRLNPLCLALSPVALAVVLFYSLTKRFTSWSPLFLGLGLGVAPVGAWLAATGAFAPTPLWLCLAVLLWVGGFDTIYGCQDADYDRRTGLNSLAVKFGVRGALRVARALHVGAVAALAAGFATAPGLGWASLAGVAAMAGLLVWEHRIVQGGDLTRIDLAFFQINSWVGVVLLGFVAADLWIV